MAHKLIRYVILFLTLIAMTMLLANSVLFNFIVICMKPEHRPREISDANATATSFYSSIEEGWIIAASSVGLICGTVPAILMTDKLGLQFSFALFGWISGVSTIVYPFVASNMPVALIVRFAQGFGMASAFVAIGIVPIEYGGDKLKSFFLAVLTCSYQIGPFLTIPFSARVYYLFGSFTMLVFFVFPAFYRNPVHKKLSKDKVLPKECEDDGELAQGKKGAPYKAVLTSCSVWGILSASIGDSLGFLVFYLYGPIYVHKVLHFGVEKTGLLVALPYIVGMASKFLAGMFTHKSTFMKSSLGILSSTAVYKTIMAVNFFLLTVLAPRNQILAEVVLIVTSAANGFHFMGLMTAAQVIAKQHTYIISSAIAALESVVGLILPPCVSYLAPDHSADQWAIVFYYVAGILALSNVLFVVLTRVKSAPWAMDDGSCDIPHDKLDTISVLSFATKH